jgi:hypothetical protein
MLSGKIVGNARDAIDLDGEKALMDNYGVQSIKKRGKKRYDVLFSTERARNEALGYKRLQAGGVAIEVEEWKRIVRLDPCWKCWRVGHEPRECTAGYLLCRYCGAKNTHDSKTCPYKHIESLHMCGVCNNKKGHYACDRDKCPYYIKSYKNLCDSLKVSAPEKILAKTANLAYADGCSNILMFSNTVAATRLILQRHAKNSSTSRRWMRIKIKWTRKKCKKVNSMNGISWFNNKMSNKKSTKSRSRRRD